MKCLFLDCGTFRYELDHPTPAAEATEHRTATFENAMVISVCVESGDSNETINLGADTRSIYNILLLLSLAI